MNFKVGGQRIPTVPEELVKSFRRWFNEYLKDFNQKKETFWTLQEGLYKIYCCPLLGKFMVGCRLHIFIPISLRLPLVYEIVTSTVKSLEAKINNYT